MSQSIFIASDHAGFELKSEILKSLDVSIVDLGTKNLDRVDYTDYADILVSNVLSNNSKGILICGSGIGMAIAANRNRAIRAGLAFNPEIAKLMIEHNNANVLVLPGRFMSIEISLKCVNNFINSKFEGGRHQKRIDKLS
jgi:ribose 5-phosphate isomerase B|tara:strand:- start:171 stop:590 length:420 start_codon:yes stop_codon:yes gene_type:complete